jgi:hypothetical protein
VVALTGAAASHPLCPGSSCTAAAWETAKHNKTKPKTKSLDKRNKKIKQMKCDIYTNE